MSEQASLLVNLPSSFQVEGIPYHKEPVSISLAGKSTEWFLDNLEFAIRQRCADANAGKNQTDAGRKAVLARLEKLRNGELIGSGPRGPRQSYEDKAELQILTAWFLTDQGINPANASKKQHDAALELAKKSDVWETITRRYVFAVMQQKDGLTQTQIREYDKQELQMRVKNGIEKIKAKFQPDITKKAAELKAAATQEKKVLDVSDLAL